MNVVELIEAAKARRGSLQLVAESMGKRPTNISEWKSGKVKPQTGEIAVLADMAGLPILETVAEVEREVRPQYANIWAKLIHTSVPKS